MTTTVLFFFFGDESGVNTDQVLHLFFDVGTETVGGHVSRNC